MLLSKLSKKVIICSAIGVVSFLLLVSYVYVEQSNHSNPVVVEDDFFQEIKEEKTEPVNIVLKMMVDVKGEVIQQGVYELEEGARVQDAVKMAGGFTKDADLLQVNLAELIYDEMVIYVPKVGDEVNAPQSNEINGKVQINRASIEELQTLTGIGPSKAAAIKAYIEEQGPLKTVEDLLNVTGIGEKTLEKIKEQIVVSP
ncbi:helix-hairpin-helix domain-containing protein [Litchfieldia alkalitelluris]|uniref:helix-hairpin-helix domain-containing protein n=1 Tax=Litchfieldia alkalitelluris TaxID=304268 RepID=UPI001F1DD98D|nr:helix-hairpin-helix domain-containing protein [Litchfieldia alkalitelluris]